MALPGAFPIYAESLTTGPYHVSLSIPGPNSEISKSIGATSSTGLLLPNIEFLTKFIGGEIGIGDAILKGMMLKNFNSSEASKNEDVFRNFAKLSKIDLEDISKYKKDGRFVLPKDQIKIAPEFDSVGLKSIEKTSLKSIFETQKPYIEIAKITVETLGKIEDIIARVMPLLSVTPLTSKSEKPTINSGTEDRPKALGYKDAEELKKSLSSLEGILATGGETKVDKEGKVIRNTPPNPSASTETPNTNISSGTTWKILSTVYSTGEFKPDVDYVFKYIDLPSDVQTPLKDSALDLKDEDPYQKYKPKSIILGIFDSNGNPLNPNEKLKAYSNDGTVALTNYKKADWVLKSPKWKFQEGQSVWPSFGQPFFIWEKGSTTRESKTNPNPDDGWSVKRYKEDETNLINGEDAIVGAPIITRFEVIEEVEYRNFFSDLINFRLRTSDLDESEKSESAAKILSQVDVRTHLENVFLYGQSNSSSYKLLGGNIPADKNPFPLNLRRSFKPFKVYSAEAANDEKLKAYALSRGEQPGYIWIDPESDYLSKIIRVDPSTRIKYKVQQDAPVIESEIKSFVKNVNKFIISDNRLFDIEVRRQINGEFVVINSESGISEYFLENWNYFDVDGLITQFGTDNQAPILNNDSTYKLEIWSNTATNKYVNLSFFGWKESDSYVEIIKEGDSWSYNKFSFDLGDNTDVNLNKLIESLDNTKLNAIYTAYLNNPNGSYSFTVDDVSYSVLLSTVFSKRVDLSSDGINILEDGTVVNVVGGKITKWFYVNESYSNDTFNINNLAGNGLERTHSININAVSVINTSDAPIPQFQIRVKDINFPNGRIIDPSKILNEDLIKEVPFSSTKYGHAPSESPYDLDILNRYMLTEFDVESYYIIEGVLPEVNSEVEKNSNANANGSGDSDKWYKLPDAIGAIKVFINMLVDVFSKLIPNIQKLIKLFKSPAGFITDIISEKLQESVSFLSKNAQSVYKSALKSQKEIESTNDPIEKKSKVNKLRDTFKESELSNYIYVGDDGKITSVLDGLSTIPFGIFGINLPFGMKMDFSSMPDKSPLELIFPSDLKAPNIKNLQDKIKPKAEGLTKDDYIKPIVTDKDMSQPNLNPSKNETDVTSVSDLTQIKFEDGSSILIKDNSLNKYVIDNKSKYNFVYVRADVEKNIKEADTLIESGTEQDLQLAKDKLDGAKKSEPDNSLIDDKLEIVNGKLDKLKSGQQPMLKLILGIVTLPVKIIGGIIEWIMEFFKGLSNPTTLPSKVAELLSFEWVMQFFTPKGILEMMGIKFNPDKVKEWKAKVNIKGKGDSKLPKSLKLPEDIKIKGYNPKLIKSGGFQLKDDDALADLSEMLSVAFNVTLPKLSALQHRQSPSNPTNLLTGLLCFIEKIINSIIDFVWSTLGIEAIIKPPHIKLCDDDDDDDDDEGKTDSNKTDANGDPKTDAENNASILNGDKGANLDGFIYEVTLPNGDIKKFLDRDKLDEFIENNKDINYDFNF